MPLIETKGAASAQGFGLTIGGAQPVYIEDVFSTYLYTGNGSTQTITNNIDLSGKGGLVITKSRSSTTAPWWINTNSIYDALRSDSTAASQNTSSFFTGFTANGYTLNGTNDAAYGPYGFDINNVSYVSWTFRKQPKFFDVVTFTGNGSLQTISHSLNSLPGCLIYKRINSTSDWYVVTRKSSTEYVGLKLNTTGSLSFTDTPAALGLTSTTFDPGYSFGTVSGGTYVAYLFAHDAGGFGLSGSDNVISCGSYAGGSGAITVNLGWEPQWILRKNINATNYWEIVDVMRGMPVASNPFNSIAQTLFPNVADAESAFAYIYPNSTGFVDVNSSSSQTFIYIAIRRGPMKVPTSGTSVYNAVARTGTSSTVTVNTTIIADAFLIDRRNTAGDAFGLLASRLTGSGNNLYTPLTSAEVSDSTQFNTIGMDTITLGTASTVNSNAGTYINWFFKRAPGFFDVVCYTGTGSNTTINHNLGVAPELIIGKTRSASSDWPVFADFSVSAYKRLYLSLTNAAQNADYTSGFGISSRSATTLGLQTISGINQSGQTQVLYLFTTCAGVSKVGSYTGTGALQTVNCGFTGGARFVLIKRTDSTGDWYVYDSARGISSGNDPYLFLNSTAAEVTGTNYVDTTSVGFQVTAAAPAGLNANGGTYIFLAIA